MRTKYLIRSKWFVYRTREGLWRALRFAGYRHADFATWRDAYDYAKACADVEARRARRDRIDFGGLAS